MRACRSAPEKRIGRAYGREDGGTAARRSRERQWRESGWDRTVMREGLEKKGANLKKSKNLRKNLKNLKAKMLSWRMGFGWKWGENTMCWMKERRIRGPKGSGERGCCRSRASQAAEEPASAASTPLEHRRSTARSAAAPTPPPCSPVSPALPARSERATPLPLPATTAWMPSVAQRSLYSIRNIIFHKKKQHPNFISKQSQSNLELRNNTKKALSLCDPSESGKSSFDNQFTPIKPKRTNERKNPIHILKASFQAR